MRLTHRERNNATGNLEICSNNVWHIATNCDIDSLDVQVACRDLGFSEFDGTDLSPTLIDTFDPVNEELFDSQFPCSGDELSLSECIEALPNTRKKRGEGCYRIRVQCLGK